MNYAAMRDHGLQPEVDKMNRNQRVRASLAAGAVVVAGLAGGCASKGPDCVADGNKVSGRKNGTTFVVENDGTNNLKVTIAGGRPDSKSVKVNRGSLLNVVKSETDLAGTTLTVELDRPVGLEEKFGAGADGDETIELFWVDRDTPRVLKIDFDYSGNGKVYVHGISAGLKDCGLSV